MKTALVSGSTKGIGKQIGIDLLDRGYKVLFIGHTDESVKNLQGELSEYTNTEILKLDLSNTKNGVNFANELKNKNVNLDVLIWNVGLTDRTKFGDIKPEEWNKVFEANIDCPFFFIQSMKDNINPNGKIVLISSILGIIPDSVSISYGVSKAGINMLVPYLAKEFANKNITVNAIAPGFVETNWHVNKTPEQIKRIENKCLVKRFSTTKEISQLALTLIDNNYITGQVIRIDGGYNL